MAEPIPEDLRDLPDIDVARGMSYCGTGQVYRKTLFLFREQIPGRLRRIRQAWDEGRWEDYVIEVHSLKSAARWIGAMDLGDQAEALEMAGRSEDLETIASDTPALLSRCQAPERNLVLSVNSTSAPFLSWALVLFFLFRGTPCPPPGKGL